jgi:hypothetical protein
MSSLSEPELAAVVVVVVVVAMKVTGVCLYARVLTYTVLYACACTY